MPMPAKPSQEKRCLMCGCRLARKRYGDRLEDFQAYTRRRFCSLSCANSRTKGGLSRKAYHAQARKLRKKFCEACGETRKLHAHHVDEDWTNNDPPNIQTLCVFCHQYWHATHRRLGVKPSERMPIMLFLSSSAPPPEWEDCAVTATPSVSSKRRRSSKA